MSAGSLSKELLNASKKLIPGGVNSPVRSFNQVGGDPIFMERGAGSKLYDADGKEYIDYVLSWGPMILGHAHPEVLEKVRKVMANGFSFGAPTGFELELAKLITDAFASMDMIRFTSSATEACMSAIRVARAYTDRSKIIKCDGCYHGSADPFLVKAGSGVATLNIPGSPGVPPEVTQFTTSVPFNDITSVSRLLEADPKGYAALIIEPIPGNMGLVLPQKGYLSELRDLCTRYGVVLIFDETMTGFRVDMGGAQTLYGISPDMTCLGKVIGGGMPVGAYGGKKEIMDWVAPVGPVYQAGTLSGNPVAMACGIKTLKILREAETFEKLSYRTQYLCDQMLKKAKEKSVPLTINQVGSMFSLYFTDKPVQNYADSASTNTKAFAKYFHAMLSQGVYIPPSSYESWFMSLAHTEADFEKTLAAHTKALDAL